MKDKTMEEVREKIARKVLWEGLELESRYIIADQILSLPGIAILHPDQSFPKVPLSFYGLRDAVGVYQKAQQDMLNQNWKRAK